MDRKGRRADTDTSTRTVVQILHRLLKVDVVSVEFRISRSVTAPHGAKGVLNGAPSHVFQTLRQKVSHSCLLKSSKDIFSKHNGLYGVIQIRFAKWAPFRSNLSSREYLDTVEHTFGSLLSLYCT